MSYPSPSILKFTLFISLSLVTFNLKAQYTLGESAIVASSLEGVSDSKKMSYVVGELFTTISSSSYIFSTTILDGSNINVSSSAVKAMEQLIVDVYPNPVTDYVQIDPKGSFTDHAYYLNLYDVNGKPVHMQDIAGKKLKGKYVLNLKEKSLSPGIYFLQIQSSELHMSVTKRIALAF